MRWKLKLLTVFFVIHSLLVSFSQSNEYYNLSVEPGFDTFDEVYVVNFNVVQPSDFPNPEEEIYERMFCDVFSGNQMRQGVGPEFLSFADSFDGVSTLPSGIKVGEAEVSCETDRIVIRAPSIQDAINLLSSERKNTSSSLSSTENGLLRFMSFAAYRYPSIRSEFYMLGVNVEVDNSSVSAEYLQDGADFLDNTPQEIVVAIKQGEEFEPVLFDGQFTSREYDSNQPLLIAVNRGTITDYSYLGLWDYVQIDFQENTLSWWLDEAPE